MKLLIVKLSSLGDVVQAMEAVDHVPDAEIHWVIEKPFFPLVKDIATKIYVADTKKWRKNPFKYASEIKAFLKQFNDDFYDVAIDLQGNIKSSLILPFVNARKKVGFGKKSVPEKINLFFTNNRFDPPAGQNIRLDYLYLLEKGIGFEAKPTYTKKTSTVKNIMVCPGSAWENKKLRIDHLIAFLKTFHKDSDPHFSILWGNDQEKKEAEEIAAALKNGKVLPKQSLESLKETMSSMDLVVAMDSFPLHLASSLKIPTYAFFGPSSAQKYAPLDPASVFIQGPCPYGKTFTKRCPILRTCPTGACLKSLI